MSLLFQAYLSLFLGRGEGGGWLVVGVVGALIGAT